MNTAAVAGQGDVCRPRAMGPATKVGATGLDLSQGGSVGPRCHQGAAGKRGADVPHAAAREPGGFDVWRRP